jgi:hypothetical protein
MKRLMVLLVVALLTSSMLLFAGQMNMKAEADYPLDSMYVVPSQVTFTTNNASLGTLFNVTVWAYMQSDTFSWQVEMTFNPAVVQAVNAGYTDGSKSVFFENFTETVPVSPLIDNVAGSVVDGESLIGSEFAPQTNASLCWVEFEIVSVPSSTVTQLTTTFKIDNGPYNTYFESSELTTIPLTYFNGQYAFIYVAPSGVHDVAVTDVIPTENWTYQGWSMNVNVTTANLGDFTENVTLTLNYSNTITNGNIGTPQTVQNLGPNENQTVTFTWNTAGLASNHTYVITAFADISPEVDNNMTNNVLQSPTNVQVRILGDMNGDGTVDIYDAIMFSNYFGLNATEPRWNPYADLDQNNVTDIFDAIILASHFGQSVTS